MSGSTERLWVSLVNSSGFRRVTESGIGASVLESDVARQASMARRYASSYYYARKDSARFQNMKTFCLFIGHTKSGSSMLGSMLDAHPNAIIADGSDALQYVPAHFSKEQLFHILLKCSRREAMKGRATARRLTPYSFEIPDQWQGRYEKLQVVGDTTSETAIRHVAANPHLLDNLRRMMRGVDVKYIHVIRNPFDPIGVMRVRGKRTIEDAVDRYFGACQMLADARQHIDDSDVFAVRYEDVISRPEDHLRAVCSFLDLTADEAYLQACINMLDTSPHQNRRMVEWDPHWINVIEQKIKQFDFLEGYSFDN